MRTNRFRSGLAVAAAVAALSSSAMPSAVAQTAENPVDHDTFVHVDGAGSVVATCAGVGTATGSRLTVVYTGKAVAPGALTVVIGCGVKQGGSVVAYSRNALPGSGGASAGTANLSRADFEVCLDLTVAFIDGSIVEHHGC